MTRQTYHDMIDLLRYDRSDEALESILADMMAMTRRLRDHDEARAAVDGPALEAHTALGRAQEHESEFERQIAAGHPFRANFFQTQARQERQRADQALADALNAFGTLERQARIPESVR